MTRKELCERLGCLDQTDGPGFEVTGIADRSEKVAPGSAFVAMRGAHVDAHDFAGQAVAQGAVVILGERPGLKELSGAPYIRVAHAQEAAGLLAQALQGDPSKEMVVIGITGTNGKSSTAFLTQAVLTACGASAANLGTIGYMIGGKTLNAAHTTPFGVELAEIFASARAAKHSHVVMEVSSHALAQRRTAGIAFDVAAFTNLTQDHLDYHGDMEGYRKAKEGLFQEICSQRGFGVVNADDEAAPYFVQACQARCYSYGAAGVCRAEGISMTFGGVHFTLVTPWGEAPVRLNLLGRHNIQNALCAASICCGLGYPVAMVAAGLGSLKNVPGRFEAVDGGQDFYVIVDYAHTEDGLHNVLRAARELCEKRVITVFGCGGDRDRGKRPKMAGAAAAHSDYAILTSDNPRTEDPQAILDEVEQGLVAAGWTRGKEYEVLLSREAAIERALSLARSGDLVMIAGKGHEEYQILGEQRIHFDDREVARSVLRSLQG